ncbi:MAG TPA: hypothetical protein VMX79_12390 [bacterium]|nr:hypothetical protein [bacterium]
MKKVALLVAFVLVATSVLAADPSKIIVKYDVFSGYGEAVITALKAKWPTATITSYSGATWPTFDSQLVSGTWDIVIVEAHNYPGTATQYQHMADWYNKKIGPLFYADWSMNNGNSSMLVTAMGGSVPTSVPMTTPPAPHYAWATTHPICSGITNWTYGNPGYRVAGQRMPWTTAVPVTGWTTTQTPSQGGIMVAADKHSVISGYFPSLNTTQPATLWSNILDFMWGSSGVAPQSLGKVKALYK